MSKKPQGLNKIMQLRVSERAWKMLEAEAAEEGAMVSEIIRRIINDHFKEKEEKYARLVTG